MQNRSSSTDEHKTGETPESRTDERTPPVNAVPEQAETVAQAEHRTRRKRGRAGVVASAAVAMFASGQGMWTFIGDLPGMNHWYLILPMFLLFDLAAVVCAYNARLNKLKFGRIGTEGWLVWLFAGLSGFMSAADADGAAVPFRFAAPLVAAIMFELLIRGERRDITNHDGPLARIKRRTLARFGLLDDVDQDDEQAARTRMAARLATLAYRVHQNPEGTRARRKAVGRYHRKLRVASERMQFATDDAMITDVRIHLDALYRSVSGTSPDSVADLNVWRSAGSVGPVVSVGSGEDDVPESVGEDLSVPVTMGGPLRPRRGPRRRRVGKGLRRRPSSPVVTAQPAPEPVAADGSPKPGSRPARTAIDVEAYLERHGEELAEVARKTGKLSRYRVEQVTGLKRPGAERVLEQVLDRVAAERQNATAGASV